MRTASICAAMLAALSIAGCASFDKSRPAQAPANPPQEHLTQFAIPGGIASWYQSPPGAMILKFADGNELDIHRLSYVNAPGEIDTDGVITVSDNVQGGYKIGTLDARPVFDSELWMMRRPIIEHVGPKFLGATRTSSELIYQACKDDKIYTSASLPSLMRVVSGESDAGKEKDVTTSDLGKTRLPVCNWRHRVGLDALLPAPEWVAHVKAVPAYDEHLGQIDVTFPTGSMRIYSDAARRLKKIETRTNGHEVVFALPENDRDCDRLDKCQQAQITFDQKTATVMSLDDRPMVQSRLYKGRDKSGAERYYACQGGKLYVAKTQALAENELKIATQNPAMASDHKGPPMDFKDAMTTESGVMVIPDQFCDWDYQAEQMKKLHQVRINFSFAALP